MKREIDLLRHTIFEMEEHEKQGKHLKEKVRKILTKMESVHDKYDRIPTCGHDPVVLVERGLVTTKCRKCKAKLGPRSVNPRETLR